MSFPNPAIRISTSESTSPEERMTIGGVVWRTALLLAIAFITMFLSWEYLISVDVGANFFYTIASMALAIIILVHMTRHQHLMGRLAFLWAGLQGVAFAAISSSFERKWPGIVFPAVVVTFGILWGMLLLHSTGILRLCLQNIRSALPRLTLRGL